jgi:hypothetical protein
MVPPGELSAEPTSVDLGTVPYDYSRVTPASIIVSNPGIGNVSALNVSIENSSPMEFAFVSSISSRILNAGESVDIVISALDNIPPGAYSATIRISGDNAGEAVSIPLSFTVNVPPGELLTAPHSVDFGAVPYNYGKALSKPVTIFNVGKGDIANLTVSVTDSTPKNFAIASGLSSNMIAAGENVAVTVSVLPNLAPGTYKATLAIAGDNATASVNMPISFTVNKQPPTSAKVTKWHKVKITGTPKVKKTLKVKLTKAKLQPGLKAKYTYQWYAGSKKIKKATKSKFKLTAKQKKKFITVSVTLKVAASSSKYKVTGTSKKAVKSKKTKKVK